MRKTNQLAATMVAKAKPGRYGDGAGLWLQVTTVGNRSWLFRYGRDGKKRAMGLGPTHSVTLAEARVRAREARHVLLDDEDPIELKHRLRSEEIAEAARSMTFKACADAYLSEHLATFRNAKHRWQWADTIGKVNKRLGKIIVAEIDTAILVKFLDPIWEKTPETASRMRGRIESVLDWAKARAFRQGENPARWKGHLEHLLKALPKQKHLEAMPFAQLPAFIQRLRECKPMTARALELCILTATRTSELLGAQWSEIDLEAETWTVPAMRTKTHCEHRVPLSARAMELLHSLPGDQSGFVFPGKRAGKSLNDTAMRKLLNGMNDDGFTVHGFRSTFCDWAGEATTYPHDVVEMALAHALKSKVVAAYRRGDAFDKRRRLMTVWASYCASTPTTATVVSIGSARKAS